MTRFWLLLLGVVSYLSSDVYSMAVVDRKVYKVCTSSTCSSNGSGMLLDAMQALASSDLEIKGEYCLGGCCQGIVVKGTGRRHTLMGVLVDEAAAVAAAETLLSDMNGLDEASLSNLNSKLAAGERVLYNSEPPEVCQNCKVSLQLYRNKCAKCGKYPY